MRKIEIGHKHGVGDITRQVIEIDGEFGISECFFANSSRIWYEVYRIKKNAPYEAFGRIFEACESIPSDNEWGKWSKTCSDLAYARKTLEILKYKATTLANQKMG